MKEIRKVKVKLIEEKPGANDSGSEKIPINIPLHISSSPYTKREQNPFIYNPVDFYSSHLRSEKPKTNDSGLFVVNHIGKIFNECMQFPSAVYVKHGGIGADIYSIHPYLEYTDVLFNSLCFPKANLTSAHKFKELYKVLSYLADKYRIIDTIKSRQIRSNPMFKELTYAYMVINKVINCCIDIVSLYTRTELNDICESKEIADDIFEISKLKPFDIMDVYDAFIMDAENSDEED